MLCIAVCNAGCSTTHPSKLKTEPEDFPQPEVSVLTIEEQAVNEVMASPLEFVVPYPEATYSWERTKMFFTQYTSRFTTESVKSQADTLNLSNEVVFHSQAATAQKQSDNYLYNVTRSLANGGYKYHVTCQARGPQALPVLATRNAGNLARFIREGKLEVSLLDR